MAGRTIVTSDAHISRMYDSGSDYVFEFTGTSVQNLTSTKLLHLMLSLIHI